MTLPQSLIAVNVIETLHSYAQADDPLLHREQEGGGATRGESPGALGDEGAFWEEVLRNPSGVVNQVFEFHNLRLSEWVARVPGLYWKPESTQMRASVKQAQKKIRKRPYPPKIRSGLVMSGVGTLRLPESEDGARLGTLMFGGDASAGVPALLSAEVWERARKGERAQQGGSCEGRIISGRARWVSMAQQWATNFPVIHSLPRGYLLLNDADAITVEGPSKWTYVTPFSIMEYEAGGSELFDYVYACVCTHEADYHVKAEDFMERYRKNANPCAHYLTASDTVDPMWDAEFASPAELRAQDAGAKSQLDLLEERVREHMLGRHVIETLLDQMGERVGSLDDLKVLSGEIALPPAFWLVGGSLAEQINQFVDAALQHGKLNDLIQRLLARFPDMFVDSDEERIP